MADQPKPSHPAVQIAPGIVVKRAKDYRAVYSNAFRLRLSGAEAGIIFSLQTDDAGVQVIEEEAFVLFGFTQLKLIAEQLRAVAMQIESVHGALVPESVLTEQADAARQMAATVFPTPTKDEAAN